MKALVVLTTVPNMEEAASLSKGIVEAKLAACVQMLPGMRSFYFWEGAVQDEAEHLLLIKTVQDKYEALEAHIREKHSYDVPEIVALNAEEISEPYFKWLVDYVNG